MFMSYIFVHFLVCAVVCEPQRHADPILRFFVLEPRTFWGLCGLEMDFGGRQMIHRSI
jgi:hypothetical protein